MQPSAAKVVAEGIMKGVIDVFEAMLPVPVEYTVSNMREAGAGDLAQLSGQYTVSWQGHIKSGLGSVALLFTVQAATHLAALMQESDAGPSDAISDSDRAMLTEMAEAALGGGVSNVMERFGRTVEQLDQVAVTTASEGDLAGLLGATPTLSDFTITAGPLSAQGIVLHSASIEDAAPASVLSAAMYAPSTDPMLTTAEMTDILSGFGPAGGGMGGAPAPAQERPANLDMVLDIQLTATARLGRVEMTIGDILNLGPGSIVEVGQIVDEPIELLINNKLVARGDVVVVDEKFGLRITEVLSPQARIESLR